MPGPPPNPNRRRRNAGPTQTDLPAGGFRGDVPDWPLPPDLARRALLETVSKRLERTQADWAEATGPRALRELGRELDKLTEAQATLEAYVSTGDADERAAWAQLWRTPMAAQWARLGWARDVALYVRCQLLAEHGDMSAAAEARQRGDRLGMTPLALLRLQWRIDGDAEPEQDAGDEPDNVTQLYA